MDSISIFGLDIYWQGVVLGLCTFLIIGIFHPLVVKAEYYFGTRSWWVFLIFGIICGIAPLLHPQFVLGRTLGHRWFF